MCEKKITHYLEVYMESKQNQLERLRRQLKNLQANFLYMVDALDEDEVNKMLDWMNEIKKAIEDLETQLDNK